LYKEDKMQRKIQKFSWFLLLFSAHFLAAQEAKTQEKQEETPKTVSIPDFSKTPLGCTACKDDTISKLNKQLTDLKEFYQDDPKEEEAKVRQKQQEDNQENLSESNITLQARMRRQIKLLEHTSQRTGK